MTCTYHPPLHLCVAAQPYECDACGGDVCEGCAARRLDYPFGEPVLWCHDENCVRKHDSDETNQEDAGSYDYGAERERDEQADNQRNIKR